MGVLYEKVVRPLLFKQDPERMHDLALFALQLLGNIKPLCVLMEAWNQRKDCQPIELFGLQFPNAVGLAAGFDKNGHCYHCARALGFGHTEVGTITYQKQPGNPRPRLFRIPESEALINSCGFPNDGAKIIAQRLASLPKRRKFPIGINIGKSKAVSIEQAAEDYLASFTILADYADYFTINVSSPNTPDLRTLQGERRLFALLQTLQKTNVDRARKMGSRPIPLLLKIAPDITFLELDEILSVLTKLNFDGIIATNTTVNYPYTPSGGLSGRPLFERALQIVKYIHSATNGKLPIIGCGGIMDATDAGQFIDAGASLVQIYTAMVYRGPFIGRDIARAIAWKHMDWL